MLFLYFVFIAHFTKFTRGSSLFMENLCSWKNQKRKKVLGEKTRRKEERKGTTLSGKEKKNLLWKRLVLAELLRWLPDFEQRSRCQSKIWRTWCWKRGYLFFMQVPALIQKTSTSASNRDFKAVCRFVVLLLSSFCGFSIFAAGFSFAFGNFARYCNVLLNAPLSDRDKKKVFEMGYFSREILIRRHWRQEVLSSYWFAVSGGEIISWRGASCLRTFMS